MTSTDLETKYAEQRPPYRTVLWRQARRTNLLLSRPSARWRRLPDYLLIGAQRAGTTSLQRYLDDSPAVLTPRFAKGVHWFDVAYDRSLNWYRSSFPLERSLKHAGDRAGGRAITGEASPYYLYHPAAATRIATQLPEVRILVVLRDPVQRAWSHYHHERARGFETLSFEAAVAAEPERLAGTEQKLLHEPTARSFSHQHHSYLARGRYAEQLERLFAHVDRSRVLVIDSGDLRADPEAVCRQTASFLGIPPWQLSNRIAHNARRYEPLPERLEAQLRRTFREPDHRLEELLGREFSWMST